MGSNCTSCKMSSSNHKNKRNKTSNNYINKSMNNTENKPSLINLLKNYIFFSITKSKNDHYIECDLHLINTEELENIVKYFEKWTKIISLSRTERKTSYRNLVCEKEKNEKKTIDLNNQLSTTNNFEIKIYNGRDKFFSDLIIKLQIAYMYNKDRYIKYLSKGPPNNIRWAIWLTLAITDPNSKFLTQAEYIDLTLKKDADFEASYEEQIKKDIKRSNIGLEFLFEQVAEDCLYRILKALSLMDPELGYCQGMNIITANLLMISDCNELETFNLMHYLLNNLELREFFLNGFPKLIMFIFIFKEFIKDQYPLIHEKLDCLDIPEELWIFKWLQTLFFMSLPLAISVRIMDCILCFGLEFLLNFSLSWIKVNESKIISCHTMEQFIEVFKGPEILEEEVEENETEDKTAYKFVTSEDINPDKHTNKADANIDELKKSDENKKDLNFQVKQGKDDNDNNDINVKNFIQKESKIVNYSIKNAYFRIFDFTDDIVFFRENLVRDAKCLCIRDLIDKMIEKYSYNHHPLFNFNPNNVIFNNNKYYDESNGINPNFDNHNEDSKDENKLSKVSSPKSIYSNSVTSRSIMNELSQIDSNDEEEEKDNDISEKIEKIGLSNGDQEDNKSKISRINNEIEIYEESSYINGKNYTNEINGEVMKKDSGYKKSIIFKTNNNLDNIQSMSTLKQDISPSFNRKTNFIFPKNLLNFNVKRNKSVKFEIFNDDKLQNTISFNKNTENKRDNYDKRKTLDYFNESLKNKNLYNNGDEIAVVTENVENPHYFTQRCEETNDLHKISGKTNFTSIENLNIRKMPTRNVRQSLNLNFSRRLNIDQILMMNKIKSKMSIIQTLNENKPSKKSILRDINNAENAKFNKLQEKIFVKNQETTEHLNNRNQNFEKKRTISDFISSTTERKNSLNTENNLNFYNEKSKMDISNNILQTDNIKENNLSNSNNQILNINNDNTIKRRNTTLPFLYQSPLDKNQNSEFDENILKSNNNQENKIGNFLSKNINISEGREIDSINKNINNKNINNKNINIDDKSNKAFKGLQVNIDNIIIEEEPGLGNGEDN